MTNRWRDHSSGVLAISSTFSPSWILMAYWCTGNWVYVKRLIKHGALFWRNRLRNQANACTILSSLWTPQCHGSLELAVLINKTEHCWRQPKKGTQEKLDASVDLNEVCLHITYLLLKELVFVSDVLLLFICCPMRICIHCRKWYQESFHQNRLL